MRRRPSLSHILIGVAVVLAFGLNYLALQDRASEVMVALADSAIPAGTSFDSTLIRLTPVSDDFAGLDNLIVEDDLALIQGQVFTRSVAEGGLIDRTFLVDPGSGTGLRSMSIPVAVEHADGGVLAVGDRVDVISVVEDEATYVATDLEVIDHADQEQGALAGAGGYHVIVAVTAEQALAIANAIDVGSLELVRSTGASPVGEDQS